MLLEDYFTVDELVEAFQQKGIRKGKRGLARDRELGIGLPWTRFGQTILYPKKGAAAALEAGMQLPRSRRLYTR
jgi:hypothetical protein